VEQQIFVPDIGDYSGVEVIDIVAKVGDNLKKDDTMITLETDKATMDIPAPMNLTINQMHLKTGDKVSKGTLIATVQTAVSLDATELGRGKPRGGSLAHASSASTSNINKIQDTARTVAEFQDTRSVSTVPAGLTGFSNASPGIRKFARELGVNLADVSGTSKNGRISEHDVKNYINQMLTSNLQNKSNNVVGSTNNLNNPSIDFSKWGAVNEQPLSRIKKKSGQHLHKNWLTIPHVTHFDTADITDLEVFRNQQQQLPIANGIKLTPLAFFIKAAVNSLNKYPNFNSSLSSSGESLIIKKYYHIGIAVDTEAGLVVPLVKNADQKNIFELAAELAAISQKARENKLAPEDMQGGCFTISSLGGIGGCNFTPIINAPEVAILGISRSKITPSYINGQLQPRLNLPLALSYDHRVIDGAEAAKFCKFIVQQLEDLKNFYV
jgi:pyruvate dehydrogenase E2 component (dihydrolipoamide acetyltransferase)